jgi:predicted transcriptional regulator YdeE
MVMKMYRHLACVFSFALVVTCTLTAISLQAEDAMKPKPSEQAAFDVIGIEVRTNNAQEATSGGAIPQQWQRLYMQGVLDRIPARLDQSVVAVYTSYASDWNGDYNYILGARVKPGAKPPAGMVSVSVPAGQYVEFTSARGPAPQVVPGLWKEIWAYFHQPGNPARAYKADFEVYEDMSDPNNVQMKIYIGVKP